MYMYVHLIVQCIKSIYDYYMKKKLFYIHKFVTKTFY